MPCSQLQLWEGREPPIQGGQLLTQAGEPPPREGRLPRVKRIQGRQPRWKLKNQRLALQGRKLLIVKLTPQKIDQGIYLHIYFYLNIDTCIHFRVITFVPVHIYFTSRYKQYVALILTCFISHWSSYQFKWNILYNPHSQKLLLLFSGHQIQVTPQMPTTMIFRS